MTWPQLLLSQAGVFLLIAAFAGLLVRRRYASWWFFTAYLAWTATFSSLVVLWPARFWRWDYWLVEATVSNILSFATALELAFRTFRRFPGAMSTLRWVILVVLALTLAQLVLAQPANPGLAALVSQQHTVVLNGAIWLFTVIGAVVLWYRLPIGRFQKRVLLSWVPYLFFATVFSNALAQLPVLTDMLDAIRQIAATLLGGYWAYLAWRRDPPPRPVETREPDRPGLVDVATAAASTLKLHRASMPDRPA